MLFEAMQCSLFEGYCSKACLHIQWPCCLFFFFWVVNDLDAWFEHALLINCQILSDFLLSCSVSRTHYLTIMNYLRRESSFGISQSIWCDVKIWDVVRMNTQFVSPPRGRFGKGAAVDGRPCRIGHKIFWCPSHFTIRIIYFFLTFKWLMWKFFHS